MENQSEQNQQSVLGGQGLQANDPQAPVIQATESTITINYGVAPQHEPAPSETPQNLPYSGVIAFVGREQELEQIHQQLQQSSTVAISAIAGMDGIGKTELALQYGRKHCREGSYPGGLCWIQAREDAGTQIISFVRSYLDLTPPEDLELVEKVRWCWRRWRNGEALLIFDDVQKYEDIESFLPPQESRFKVLMTSRSHFGSPVQELQLDALSKEEALELLRSLVGDDRVDQEIDRAKELCKWLGSLPLGMELVGRYLAEDQDMSLQDLWQELQDQRITAEALNEVEEGMTASLGVLAAFELSWKKLIEEAQQLAAVLSLFALVEIPWTLVEQCLPEVNKAALKKLRNKHLLKLNLLKRVDQGMYQLHQLLKEFFALKREQRSDAEELKRKFYEVVIAGAERVRDKPERSFIKESTMLLAHLQAAINLLKKLEQELESAMCLFWIAELYYSQGRYGEAEPFYLKSLSVREQQLGRMHPDVAISLNNLATLYYSLGRYSEIEPLLLRARSIREQHLGIEHPEVAFTLSNLASFYKLQGHHSKAEALNLRALSIREQYLGTEHPEVAFSLNNLADLYVYQGRYSEAEPLHLRALSIREQHLGVEHPDVAFSLSNLGLLYYLQGCYSEAEPLYLRALSIRQQQLGRVHPDIAHCLNSLAVLYNDQGRYSEAEPLLLRSLSIWEQQVGEMHSSTANSLNNLAMLYHLQGRYSEAELLHQRALSIREQQLGAEHPDVANSLNNLANLYYVQGHYSEAEPLYTRAYSIQEQGLGVMHPNVALSLNNLAKLYHVQKCYRKAEPLYLRALTIAAEKLGEAHPWRQKFYENFRSLLQKAIQENRTNELSDDLITQSILQELQDAWD